MNYLLISLGVLAYLAIGFVVGSVLERHDKYDYDSGGDYLVGQILWPFYAGILLLATVFFVLSRPFVWAYNRTQKARRIVGVYVTMAFKKEWERRKELRRLGKKDLPDFYDSFRKEVRLRRIAEEKLRRMQEASDRRREKERRKAAARKYMREQVTDDEQRKYAAVGYYRVSVIARLDASEERYAFFREALLSKKVQLP